MATSPKAPAPDADQAAGGPKKSNKLLLIILGLAALLVVAGGGGATTWFLLSKARSSAAGEIPLPPPKPPVFMPLEPFTVNLRMEDGAQQYLQIGMTLQMAEPEHTEIVKTYLPRVRNRLLLLLSSKSADDILSVSGKKKLAAEIIAQLNDAFQDKATRPEIADVFFTSFVVQ